MNPVRSPFLEDPPPPPLQADQLSLATTPGQGPEPEDTPPPPFRLSRLVSRLGLVAATTLLPGAAAVAGAMVPATVHAAPVSTSAATATSASPVESLLAPESRRFAPVLEKRLGQLPPAVLEAAQAGGIRVWVAPDGARHVPATFFREDGQAIRESEEEWAKWHAFPASSHGLMSMPDHRSAFVSPSGEVTLGDAVTGQPVSYGRVATLHDLALRWGKALYGTDPETLPEELRGLERLLSAMNPDLQPSAPLPAGRELYLPVSIPYQGRSLSAGTMSLVAELNAGMADAQGPRFFQFSRLLAVPEASLAPAGQRGLLEGVGRVVLQLIDDDPRYGFEHSSELAALAADAEAGGLDDPGLADPVAFYSRAFAETFAPAPVGSPASGAEATWATARPLIERDVRWLAGRAERPAASPGLPVGDPAVGAPVACPSVPGPDSPVRTEMLDAASLRERYAANAPILRRMTDSESWARFGPGLGRDLGILPTGLLQRAEQEGIRIFVLADEMDSMPARLFAEDAAGGILDHKSVQVAEGDRVLLNGVDPVDPSPRAGQTLADVARDRGARAPDEIRAFVEQASALNRLTPTTHLLAGQRVDLPDLYFYQGRRYTLETVRAIDQMNQAARGSAGFFRFWEDGRLEPIVMLKARHLCDRSQESVQKNIPLHEFGHVSEFLSLHDPATRPEHNREMLDIRASAARHPGEMLTGYSRVHPAEQYADAFEAYFTSQRPGTRPSSDQADDEFLRSTNPRLRALIETDLGRLAPLRPTGQ